MSSDSQSRLLAAVYSCLRPLARLLLRSGVTYKQFAEISKLAFVHEAQCELDERGRRINASRIAVRTGLSRKEVRRVSGSPQLASGGTLTLPVDQSGPPAKVLHAWHSDSRFSARGKPRDLPFDGPEPSFTDLVRAVAGDVPPGAVRAELKHAAAVQELENGALRAAKRYFVPANFDEKAITVLSGIVFPLTAGVDHNANPSRKSDGFIQRFAFSDRLSKATVPDFRKWSRQRATEFIESMDDWLATHEDRTSERPAASTAPDIVGVGVFYYEGPPAESQLVDEDSG